MSRLNKVKIGYILSPGCRMADIIGTDAIFRFHPRNKFYFIAEKKGLVTGKGNLQVLADFSFADCPELDVLVVGELDKAEVSNVKLLSFIRQQSECTKFVIAVSSGVLALYESGAISRQKVTADALTIPVLRNTELGVVDRREIVVDGKFITTGPSSGAIEAAFYVLNELRGSWITRFTELTIEYHAPIQYPVSEGTILEMPSEPKQLKVGIFMGKDIYYPDVIGAFDVFSCIPNTAFYFISSEKELSNSAFGFGASCMPNTLLKDCPQLDVLIIGATHFKYIKNQELQDFILKQEQEASAIISVCAGTFVVGATGLLAGKDAATNYQQIDLLPNIGVCPTDKVVAEDGKFYSAGPAVGSYVVALKSVERIISKEWAQYIEHSLLEFNPNPMYHVGDPKNADKEMVVLNKVLSTTVLNPIFNSAIKKSYYGMQ